jgi:hypothetical protein
MIIRIVAAIIAAVCAVSTAPIAAQTPASEKTDISIAVGGKAFMIYLPLSVIERLGY